MPETIVATMADTTSEPTQQKWKIKCTKCKRIVNTGKCSFCSKINHDFAKTSQGESVYFTRYWIRLRCTARDIFEASVGSIRSLPKMTFINSSLKLNQYQ
ncbi:unnamed protein product [Fusarium graminearum]|uniref:Uncharacterized protein n=1 Tax=Gibberella zeae TaxID=5518 RepID=A0A4E9EET9_GIBZA|nr:unnamed protein product [Fusarium graminearum]CAF3572004.1 unnamed protein product [Fusarium graminearum]CAG1988070.1 unnamed protein product [Fusarium graminearum]